MANCHPMRFAGLLALLVLAAALTFHFGTTGTPPLGGIGIGPSWKGGQHITAPKVYGTP